MELLVQSMTGTPPANTWNNISDSIDEIILRKTKKDTEKSPSPGYNNLETEMPFSEKDEVKKKERKTNKAAKKST
ncbi:hypothetical protein NAF17_09575 [Mucilaginibacter sp. RB4R14]|uniref:hypothetical protein n=1 Tax=Mucilaginibacter aurantiaciroseus TaxID=2949308 RepID=UPI0020907380|nr:hypothetical protein [Mucilaginibacter aurantiaciroseus]MCO5935792.1 hypothetical protein [Mucilaginibacter aurantiaciroseus]